MNTQKQQGADTDIISRLRGALNDSTVTPSQMMQVVRSLLTHSKTRFEALYALVYANKDASDQKFNSVDASLSDLQTQIKSIDVALKTKKGKVELEEDLKNVWDQIGYIIEVMPSAYDDTSLSTKLETLQSSLKAIEDRLNEPEDEEEEDDITREEVMEMIADAIPAKSASMPANLPPPDFGPFHESFSMDGATTSVTLARGVGAQGTAIMVRYNGQMLDLGDQFTVDGIKITLQFTPANGTTVSVTYWGG